MDTVDQTAEVACWLRMLPELAAHRGRDRRLVREERLAYAVARASLSFASHAAATSTKCVHEGSLIIAAVRPSSRAVFAAHMYG